MNPRSERATRRAIRLAGALATTMMIAGCGTEPGPPHTSTMSESEALAKLDKVLERVSWSQDPVIRTTSVDLSAVADLSRTLPPISEYPITVEGAPSEARAEVCVSSEKSGAGTDGWMNEMAQRFNASGARTSSGARAQLTVRKVASGVCHEYIASGRYVPDGFSPSNVLWIRMVEARGTAMEPIDDQLVGNTAGVVMKSDVAERIRASAGAIGVTAVIEAVGTGEIAMGYTNPYASSTGLNWLTTTLMTYAGGDEAAMLDPAVVSAFETFQGGVPFVALTTMQMRDAVGDKGADGPLDAFVMERQTFANNDGFNTGWEFLPFGVRHDNPLYAVASTGGQQKETLKLFAQFSESDNSKALAAEYGFNSDPQHSDAYVAPSGATLLRAQKLWKEKKDSGKPIAAIFALDVSGSMAGEPLREVRKALREGADFISPHSAVGLVAFNSEPSVRLPVRPFSLQHKARFLAAVEELEEGGGTALYDAVAVSMRLLREARTTRYENARLRLLVLSDGETRSGHGLRDIAAIVQTLKIPVYSIAYGEGADVDELKALSGLAEAATLKANERRVTHIISGLLNAQL